MIYEDDDEDDDYDIACYCVISIILAFSFYSIASRRVVETKKEEKVDLPFDHDDDKYRRKGLRNWISRLFRYAVSELLKACATPYTSSLSYLHCHTFIATF